jgi:glycosyltransferase involved in cell wall biosynthesis
VLRYTFLTNPFQYLRSGRIDLFFAWFFFKPVTLLRLIIDFVRFKPKVVNLHFPDHQLLECYLLMLLFRFKLIISLHGNEVERMRFLSKRSLKYYLYNKLFTSAVNITGCSKFLVNELQRNFKGRYTNKCFPMYNGVSEIFLTQQLKLHKRDYIFCAARFAPIKGLDLIVKAADNNIINKLLIAGGDENDLLKLEIPINDSVTLLGSIPHSEIAKYLMQAEITVIPSRSETYGILLVEALCCGSSVVATNVGGIPEVIALATEKLSLNEKEIFNRWVKLVEPNSESIGNGIDALLNNNGSIEDYINLVPKFRNNFLWSTRLYKFHTILAEL